MSQVGTQPQSAANPGSPTQKNNSNNGIWGAVKAKGIMAGKRASVEARKAKIRTEMMLIDNKIHAAKEKFGIELFDNLVVYAESDPMFIIENDTLENIRGHFVTCFKDNKALLQKRAKRQQQLVEVGERKEIAYPKVPCETFGGQMKNAGKAANFARQETMYKTKISMIEREMKANKKNFGLEVYRLLVKLEDNDKWLPSDRDVRFLYDQTRREVTKLITEKQQKVLELNVMGSGEQQ